MSCYRVDQSKLRFKVKNWNGEAEALMSTDIKWAQQEFAEKISLATFLMANMTSPTHTKPCTCIWQYTVSVQHTYIMLASNRCSSEPNWVGKFIWDCWIRDEPYVQMGKFCPSNGTGNVSFLQNSNFLENSKNEMYRQISQNLFVWNMY